MFARPKFTIPGFLNKPIGQTIVIVIGGGGEDEDMITASIIASVALTAGEVVNIWDDSGVAKARKADANADREAHGYVIANVSSGAIATVYFNGINNVLSGLTIGANYYTGIVAGAIEEAPGPVAAGDLNQQIGFAISDTELVFIYNPPIQIGS